MESRVYREMNGRKAILVERQERRWGVQRQQQLYDGNMACEMPVGARHIDAKRNMRKAAVAPYAAQRIRGGGRGRRQKELADLQRSASTCCPGHDQSHIKG